LIPLDCTFAQHLSPKSLHVDKLASYATPPLSPAAHRSLNLDTPSGRQLSAHFGGMEGEDPHRRQYDQSGYPSSRGYGQVPRGGGSDASDRFRQPQISSLRSPTSGPRTSTAGQSQGITGYGYTQGQQQYAPQLQDAALQYQAEFTQDPQRAQQYTQYSSNLMYNMPQQTPQQSPYEPVQQFQPRQTAAVEVLSTQFGVPQYYPTGDPTSAPGPMAQQYATAPFQQQITYQQPAHTGRAALPPAYPTGMAEYVQPNVPEVLEQQEPAPDAGGYDAAYRRYVEKLRATFQDVKEGRLVEAGQGLLEISEFLLGQAVELGKLI